MMVMRKIEEMSVLKILPFPPGRLVPPRMTAVSTGKRKSSPMPAAADPCRATCMKPAKAARAPASMKTFCFTREVLIPAKPRRLLLFPAAKTRAPKRV